MLLLHIFPEPLEAGKCGVALVVVVDGRIEAEGAEGAHTADTEEKLLLEAVLPVATVELVGNLTILRAVALEVGVKQIKVCAAYCHFPYAGAHIPAREGNLDNFPASVFVEYRSCRNLEEVLSLVFRYLIALRSYTLGEVAIPVKQADCHEVDVHITGLLEVVAGEYSETSRINLEGGVKSILHTEVCYRRVFPI